MAVYTAVSPQAALSLLQQYSPDATLLALEEISAGIENTNYFLTARIQGEICQSVLTIFETHSSSEVRFFVDVLNWWCEQGFPVPAPQHDQAGTQLQTLCNKPALLIPRLSGQHHLNPTPEDCRAIGQLLGQMHRVAPLSPYSRPVERDIGWIRLQQQRLTGLIPKESENNLKKAIEQYEAQLPLLSACPHGLVHGDLFRDNVLFENSQISGLIDFYHSATDVLLFDLAVVANDWCSDGAGQLDQERLAQLLEAYRRVRPWTSKEHDAWPHQLRLAALRFWLARLVSRYLPGYQQQSISGDKTKDPFEMEQLHLYLCFMYPV